MNPDTARAHLDQALADFQQAETVLDTARVRVEDAVALAASAGIQQTEIIRVTGWSREHVRRLTRASQHRERLYLGGPLDGQPVTKHGDAWEPFRDDEGNPIDASVGDAEWGGPRRRFYYWAVQAPDGITYVHLTRLNTDGSVRDS